MSWSVFNSLEIPRGSASLERRLPFLISCLLIISLAAFGIIAFGEVRQASIAAATAQLSTVRAQSVDNMSRALRVRRDAFERLSNEERIVALAHSPTSNEAIQAAQALLEPRRDSAAMRQVLVIRGIPAQRLYGPELATPERATLDSAIAESTPVARATISRLFLRGSEVHFWIVAPVRPTNGVAMFAEQRRLRGSPFLVQQLKALTGREFSIFFTSLRNDLWVNASGMTLPPLFDIRAVPDSFRLTPRNGEPIFGEKAAVRGTPWVAIFTTTAAAVNTGAFVFLRRTLVVAIVLLSIGVLGARWVSRQVTRPLQSLTRAARDISLGDFGRRETVRSDDELGQLAAAFNRMAERIGQSHDELGRRMRESEALASELKERNRQLQEAQRVATESRIASDHARAEAQRANRAKSEFLAMMSHELRTPLSAIAGYAEILQLGVRGELNARQRGDLDRIQANQVHLLSIINDMLDLTQVESGQLLLDQQPVTLGVLLADIDPIVRPLIAERGIDFSVPPDAGDIALLADRERLKQVLINLVANAARFTSQDGFVAIRASTGGGRARIQVVDSGVGIAPEHQQQVFLPFHQVDGSASRRAKGTGLGLTISRRLVEAMGGTLALESELGVGSVFTIDMSIAVSFEAFDVEHQSA